MSRKDQAKIFFARYLPKPIRAIANLEALTLMESKPVSDAGISLYKEHSETANLSAGASF